MEAIKNLLQEIAAGRLSPEAGFARLRHLPSESLGFARLDHHRALRQGFPEAIFCEGKSDAQVLAIFDKMAQNMAQTGEANAVVLATRVPAALAAQIQKQFPQTEHHPTARMVVLRMAALCTGAAHGGMLRTPTDVGEGFPKPRSGAEGAPAGAAHGGAAHGGMLRTPTNVGEGFPKPQSGAEGEVPSGAAHAAHSGMLRTPTDVGAGFPKPRSGAEGAPAEGVTLRAATDVGAGFLKPQSGAEGSPAGAAHSGMLRAATSVGEGFLKPRSGAEGEAPSALPMEGAT